MRYAIYFAPTAAAPLTRQAAAWLGRDAFTGMALPHPRIDGLAPEAIAAMTAAPRRYGFHATLKAPFRISQSHDEAGLIAAFEQFARSHHAFTIPEMIVGDLDGFLAIVPHRPSDALDALAARAVTTFDTFRSPLTEAEFTRRGPEHLSPAEIANLRNWGYPYVLDSFRFHMTLTERLAEKERAQVEPLLTELFEPILPRPFPIDGLALFVEPEPGAPFKVLRHETLSPAAQDRKTA